MITQKAISDILKPLLATGVYKDEKLGLKDIVADYVQRKIDAYGTVILRLEQKYGKDFKTFSRDIERRASAKYSWARTFLKSDILRHEMKGYFSLTS